MPTVRSRYLGATGLFGPWLIDAASATWTVYDSVRSVQRTLTMAGVTSVSFRPVEPETATLTNADVTETFIGDH